MGKGQSKPAQTSSSGNGNGKAAPAPKPKQSAPEAGGKVTATDTAVLDLKEQRDDLSRAARRATKLSKALNAEAVRYLKESPPQRDKALRCVRRRKLYEERLKRISGMQDNVDQMLNSIEEAQFEARVVATLREGGDALRRLVKDMGDVEKAMDDVADAVADAQAVNELMAAPVGAPGTAAGIDLEDAELEAELQALVKPAEAEGAGKTGKTPIAEMPKVPTHELPDAGRVDAGKTSEDAGSAESAGRERVAA